PDLVLTGLGQLVVELVARPAAAVAGRVATLGHEVLDDAVEGQPVVEVVARQDDEVVDRPRRLVLEQVDLDVADVRGEGRRVVRRLVDAHRWRLLELRDPLRAPVGRWALGRPAAAAAAPAAPALLAPGPAAPREGEGGGS